MDQLCNCRMFPLITRRVEKRGNKPKTSKRVPLSNHRRKLHDKLPQPQKDEEQGGLRPPSALRLDVQCWDECQAYYSEHLRHLCNSDLDTALDERLKGVYGRMHVQAFKLASLFAALDWMDATDEAPTVTLENWVAGKAIAEIWRHSAAQLLYQMDRSGEAVQEQREQGKLLQLIRREGSKGKGLRELYRALNLPAKRARQLAQDLVKAGLIVERQNGRAEWYVAAEFAE